MAIEKDKSIIGFGQTQKEACNNALELLKEINNYKSISFNSLGKKPEDKSDSESYKTELNYNYNDNRENSIPVVISVLMDDMDVLSKRDRKWTAEISLDE